jgi:3'(2'), 5'-bisphosphate nucleotidase
MDYANELQALLDGVRQAAEVVLGLYEQFEAIPDAHASISTAADHQAQEIILRHLQEHFPDDAFLAEEQTPALAGRPHVGERLWIIDPIDGTRGFARKNGEFSLMAAFVHGGQIGAGVVLEPVKRRLTYATRGGGCRAVDGDGTARPCRVTATADLREAVVTQSHSGNPGRPNRYVQALKPARVVETYSAGIKLALVARGEADLYVNDYTSMHDWDLAAGDILVREAGGLVTGLHGEELAYGVPGGWQRHGVLAGNATLHKLAQQVLGRRDHPST